MVQKIHRYNISGLHNQLENQLPEPPSLDNDHVATEHTLDNHNSSDSEGWEPHVLLEL